MKLRSGIPLVLGLGLGSCAGALFGLYYGDLLNFLVFGGGVGLVAAYVIWFIGVKYVSEPV